ncbi:MAG: hypothetical protein M1830_008350 [Pleopsidium flavum]|nr:MAG: hypothetical protein M1830_008350 [Pleopsidium flavum]
MIEDDERSNYEAFRECLSGPIIDKSAITPTKPKKRKTGKGRKSAIQPFDGIDDHDERNGDDVEDLADFIEYLATETFTSWPADLRVLSYSAIQSDASLAMKYGDPLPPATVDNIVTTIPSSVSDSLISYALLSDPTSLPNLLIPVFTDYITTVTSPPPLWSTTRTTHCEICLRDWIPLTYHHLVPKQTHAKAMKRGWHEEWRLNSVAWLCRACHSFVHRVAGNEELAKEWWSVERLLEREDVQRWARWVGRVRWKKR